MASARVGGARDEADAEQDRDREQHAAADHCPAPLRPPLAEQVAADEAAVGRRRGDDHRDLVRQLVGQGFLDQQRILADQGAIAFELDARDLADLVHAIDLGVGQLAGATRPRPWPRSGAPAPSPSACRHARDLFRIGLELALFDLLLLERNDMLHRLFLGLRRDDLFVCRRLGGLLPAHLFGLALQLGLA